MKDLRLRGWMMRVFWRGLRVQWFPYWFSDYGPYCFGVGPFGVMLWPPRYR